MNKRMKLWESALLLALSAALCVGTWAQGRQQRLAEGLVRLHVLAHSDDAEEQEIKLRVRDAVLGYLQPLLSQADSRETAETVIETHVQGIAEAAAKAAEGRKISVCLSRERYPSRSYGDFALPAGAYQSLRVTLGEGAGENWWCVVYPPLCIQSASERVLPGMSREDMALLQGETTRYRLAFRSIELWESLKEKWEQD